MTPLRASLIALHRAGAQGWQTSHQMLSRLKLEHDALGGPLIHFYPGETSEPTLLGFPVVIRRDTPPDTIVLVGAGGVELCRGVIAPTLKE